MLTLRYFASIRENLGMDSESMDLPEGITCISELIDYLCAKRGLVWQDNLQTSRVLIALNQTMVKGSARISDGDEIAFFPPVTGG